MSIPAPPIVTSTAVTITTRLAGQAATPGVIEPGLLARYTTHPNAPQQQYGFAPWSEYDPVTLAPAGRSAALIGVFARLSEVVIERLNRVPEKNFLAFLSLLGAARQPPQAARVPLTFMLAPGATGDALVPAGTQAAAGTSETGPIAFETERPLVVTAAQLACLLTLDPAQDSYADWTDRLVAPAELTVFRGEQPLEHVFYVGDASLLAFEAIADLRLDIDLAEPVASGAEDRNVKWECWDGAQWRPLQASSDTTNGLRQKGSVSFGRVAAIAETSVASRVSRWLRAVLTTPITQSVAVKPGMVRNTQLPRIGQVTIDVRVERTADGALAPDLGFLNTAALDVTKGFLPFGEKPKLFDTLYLASPDALSKDKSQSGDVGSSALVSVSVQLSPQIVRPSPDLQLVWECWTGTAWLTVGTSRAPDQSAPTGHDSDFADGTRCLTGTGVVTFRLPDVMAKTVVNGQENFWLRVRLVQGDYGKEASYALTDAADPHAGFVLVPATFGPPVITSLTIGYRFEARRKPPLILTYNQLDFTDCSNAIMFKPFAASADSSEPGLYFGFSLPDGRTFPNTTISLYGRTPPSRYGERPVPLFPERSMGTGAAQATVAHSFSLTNASTARATFDISTLGHRWAAAPITPVSVDAGETEQFIVQVSIPADALSGDSDTGFVRIINRSDPDRMQCAVFATGVDKLPDLPPPDVAWRYWNGTDWTKLVVADSSGKFARSGPIEFLAPADFAPRQLFGRRLYWLQAGLDTGDYAVEPRLSGILLNTTTALQATTIVGEILGSSNGTKWQTFSSRQAPVLAGQHLEVREPAMPGTEERVVLAREEGADAIDVVAPAGNRPAEIWVRWHEVLDFHASGPQDRHYVIDHLSGEISFGDGVSGRIPPIGTGNFRLARYQSGGGSRGNCAPGAIAQLKTTVPYVDSVTNPDPADGGAEAETLDAVIERVPRTLRHRDRAVTLEDYEDLARATSPEVARSLCVPLRDLAADPLDSAPKPGAVSVIVVPRTTDARPMPSLELLDRVGDFLRARADATANVSVIGPLYLRVDVTLEVAVTVDEDVEAVERAINHRLAAFLHPLSGGVDGKGWEFGRASHRSDLLALIESVPGVDHVRYLNIVETEDQAGVRETGRFLVFSGRHRINMTVVES
jgi:hypothetical protein